MATFGDIGVAAGLNILFAVAFLIAFAILRLQPINDGVYFPKWYLLGLDSAVYLRIYLLGLKIFVPIALLSWAILVPINWTNNTLENGGASKKLEYSNIDKLSISNVPYGSPRFWTHIVMAYAFSFWTCYSLRNEYAKVAEMRLHFLASKKRRPDQFTVLVRNVPPDQDESVSEAVEHFFLVNHPDHYLTHQVVINANKLAKLVQEKKSNKNWLDYYQLKFERKKSRPMTKTGFLGLWGEKVDAIDHQIAEIDRLTKEIAEERKRVKSDPKCIMPAAFVSFKTRWGAAVCAQTQQSRNPTLWLTDWASEPRDVYWDNLAIPYVSLTIRKLIVSVAFFFLTFFFVIPVTFVQSLANIEGIERRAPFLEPIIEVPFIKSVVQGVLPGIALKIFLLVLPTILIMIAKLEGLLSISAMERISASRYYIFNFINVFLVSVIAGTAFEQLDSFLRQSANDITRIIGVAIPMKATFFITYVMVDGWTGVAGEIFRLTPLILFHLKNFFLVKTEKDREEAMDPGSIEFHMAEPRLQLYFLLGLVYAVVTPIFLPFILVFFVLAYVVFRHQIINVYNQKYESAASFWPDVHARIIYSLVFSQIMLIGLMSTKGNSQFTPFLIALVVLTIWFHLFCKGRYEPAFVRYPLQEAMMKDTLERAIEPNLDLKSYLQSAYIHPVFKNEDEEKDGEDDEKIQESLLVATTRSRRNTPAPSKCSDGSSPLLPESVSENAGSQRL
ncbi:calcium permeable stress-gated cation channel 1-like isoform X3 [Salvia hispanica]|uniref:calcium permeable stress-gated cation channel 1-like isoform X3 n=1 Tax=Salvia hispanica TaxID=49212 RepID=UPI002009D28C|nr:calcium permeable stress-gated cation channel 1-like isoform X3 [Salvia hispanica]